MKTSLVKGRKNRSFSGSRWFKYLAIMNIFFFQTLAVFAFGYAEENPITLKMNNATLSEIFDAIKKQSEFSIVYNTDDVNLKQRMNIDVNNVSVETVLRQILQGQQVDFKINGKHIVLAAQEPEKQIAIQGIIYDQKGETIVGANILEEGTTNGTSTDFDGKFTMSVNSKGNLIVSFIGYQTQTIPVNGQTSFTIRLKEESEMLDAVVVTAMGIKKKASSLTYSTQQVGGDELTRAKDANMINALAGKTAGVQINKSSSGLGGSAKVIIRGNRSASGNNQPLYVIDGMPMLNSTSEQAVTAIGGTADAGNRDGGDGISNLNPDDIESMSILKGASAAALYGSQAANGVILITTKKGHAGVQNVQFSSNLTVDHVISLPEFQNQYARKITTNEKGEQQLELNSWGAKQNIRSADNAEDFFQNGVTAINSISFTSGNDKMQAYFSYANTTAKGIVEKNRLEKHNINFRETASFFNNYLKLDGNVNLMTQSIKNRPTSGGYYINPLVGLYRFPRGENMAEYKEHFEVFDPTRNLNVQNWYYENSNGMEQNPYWIINRVRSTDKRTRMIASLNATVKITDWLKIQARGNADYINDKYKQKMYASTAPAIAGNNGRYIDLNYEEKLFYGDVMAMFDKQWGDFTLNAAAGGSISKNTINSVRLDSKTASLFYPNVFTVANINMSTSAYIEEKNEATREMQSVFATAQLGYKQSLYLDVTARNDWASTLAFTPSDKKGFFYPSVGVSWIMNNMLEMPEWINFGKIRGSWSKVGNDIPLFVSNPVDHVSAGGGTVSADAAPFDNMKPEMSTSYEVGTEWKFFNYRLDLDFTFYKTNTKNQFFKLPQQAGDRYAYRYVNAGNIENKGIEVTLGITPVMNDNFRWKTGFNFSTNKNKIKELHPDLPSFLYGDPDFSSSYAMRLVKGGSFGDIYGKAFKRDDNGRIVYGNDGMPEVVGDGNTVKVGNCNPDFTLGWNNTFSYKGFSLYFLLDGRFGGDVLSQTQADMDQMGVSKVTGKARDRGYVNLEGKQIAKENIETFYSNIVGGRNGVTEYYMYDATNIRLRELSLSYQFPKAWMEKSGFIKDIQVSFVGRNLFFLYKDAPFDPDAVLSTGNENQGIDVFGMPTTRSLGFNLKFTF